MSLEHEDTGRHTSLPGSFQVPQSPAAAALPRLHCHDSQTCGSMDCRDTACGLQEQEKRKLILDGS
eukprot:4495932-Amphidinium_carterae.1